jgi:hypothetical protein
LANQFERFKILARKENWKFLHVEDETMDRNEKYRMVYDIVKDRSMSGRKF